MSTIYGYARCSTNEELQDITRQHKELIAKGVLKENIYTEYASGTKIDRVELNKLLDKVVEGDTIIALELSRITRSTKQLCDLVEFTKEKKIKLILGDFVVDCRAGKLDAMTEGMLKMMGVFAELERNMISERVKSGMKNTDKKIGRPELSVDTLPKKFLKYYGQYKNGDLKIAEYARLCECSRQSIYKYIDIYTKK